jgi:hypothetical protein
MKHAAAAHRLVYAGFILVCALCVGCSVKLVADYDAGTAEAILQTAKSVDGFYLRLLDTPENERPYSKFSEHYTTLEVELDGLVVRNRIRALNEESTKIAETTLAKWVQYKKAHKESNAYKDVLAMIHRERFMRLFTAMAVAAEAQKEASAPAGKD